MSARKSAMPWRISACHAQPADDLAFERIVNVTQARPGRCGGAPGPRRGPRPRHPDARRRARSILTEELKPKPRKSLTDRGRDVRPLAAACSKPEAHELAEIILEESGYTEMWQNDRSAEAPTRLDNLKELVRSMEEFESMRAFLEHVSLVMDTDNNADLDAVSIMTLHSAKGLEFDTVFPARLGGGPVPAPARARRGRLAPALEEERRLAYVGLTRAKLPSLSATRPRNILSANGCSTSSSAMARSSRSKATS
jgi:DNA helicase-2/ATP-dependent DNA helicase PcrA